VLVYKWLGLCLNAGMVLILIIFSCQKLQMIFYELLSGPGYLKGELESYMDLCVITWDIKFGVNGSPI